MDLKHLQQIVFRGTCPKSLPPLTSYHSPHHTKVILTCCLTDNHDYLESYVFPQGMQLPIATLPKYVLYRVVYDEELSESSTCIDIIPADDRHTMVENPHS